MPGQSSKAVAGAISREEIRGIVQDEIREEKEKRRQAEERAERAEKVAHTSISLLRQQLLLDDHTAPWNLTGLTVGQYLRSRALDSDVENLEENLNQLWDVYEQDGQVTVQPGGESRDAMVEMHRKLADFRNGAEPFSSENERRGMRLFRRFIQYFDPEADLVGVEESHGKLKLVSKRAKQVLRSKNDIPEDGETKTVWRAMGFVCDKTKPADVDCECSAKDCKHSMFSREKGDTYILSVDKTRFEGYLQAVVDGVEEGVSISNPDDGAENASEGTGTTDEVSEELDRLTSSATTNASADTVVSGSNASPSGGI